jgi:excisionase family DNA binding protein
MQKWPKGETVEETTNKAMLTVDEVANIARVHPNTILSLARKKKLPGVLVGRQWRFSRVAVMQFFGITTSEDATGEDTEESRQDKTVEMAA